MTYNELRDAVYVLTNRPDLVSETQREIQTATLEIHARDFWPRDLIETTVVLAVPQQAEFQLAFADKFPRMRGSKFAACNVYDPVAARVGNRLIPVTVDDLFDPYGYRKTECYYPAGANVNFRIGYAIDAIYAAYYSYPIVSPTDSYVSWIAAEFPAVIYEQAAIKLLAAIGKLDASNKLSEHYRTFTWPGFQASAI